MDLNSLITVGGLSLAVANTWTANQSIDDDTLLRLGADGDNVLVNRSTSLAADAELSNVIVGTSDHQGVAANSLILSNITQNGDILGLINNAGNSLEWLLVDASALDIHYGFGGIGSHIFYGAAGSESMRVEGGIVFIGDGTTTSSGPMTRGIDLDLVGNSGLVAAFRDSTNVATGLTTGPWGTDVESSMILTLEKAAGASGGVQVKTLMEDANARPVLDFHAYGGQATTTKTTSGRSLVEFYITEHDGANSLANITTNGNIFGVRARVGGSDVARWIIDEDGDHFVVTVVDVTATGNAIAASAFDEHDDAQLVRAYELARNPNKAGLVRSKWDEFVSYNEQTLIDLGILGAPVTEGGMTNQSQLIRLHNGAIWQAYQTAREQGGRLSVLEEANQIKDAKIAELESKLALLEGAR